MSARVRCPVCGWGVWFNRPGEARRAARSHVCRDERPPHPSDWECDCGGWHPAEEPCPVLGRRGNGDEDAAAAYLAEFVLAGGS